MILYQYRIYRADLRANPDVLYIFGDNYARAGRGGQAAEMRGEANAHGIATKWNPRDCFSDEVFDIIALIIDEDLKKVKIQMLANRTVVFPLDGIGTGLSEMPTRAPKCWAYLCERLTDLGINPVGTVQS